ncbi:N-acetylmuramoyl-L-alanine amidase [Acidobacteria bacterium AH-259-D05]|nr:N-acetylmuramoyl-L-alanine amidase [Acidobacteria bacterium AH-259-D05]
MLTHRIIGSILLTILLASAAVSAWDRQAARLAYKKAREYHDQLLVSPGSEQSLKRYRRAIFLYRTVIDHDPTYGASDDALYAVATLYDEMASRFGGDLYRQRAIYYYDFMAREYPLTKHRKPALERAALLKRDSGTAPKAAASSKEQGVETKLATVSEIRYWSNEDYTRVVIQLDREVEFRKHILSDPDRIYFDLQGARLQQNLRGKTYPVNDLFLKQLRVAQNRSTVVRVVLDFEQINKHTVFALYDPFRIVIDTRGTELQKAVLPDAGGTAETANSASSLEPTAEAAEAARVTPVIPSSNLGGDRSLTRVLGLKVGRVVIDPGHGGRDTGTIGPSGLKEKDLVLAVSLRLKDLLEEQLGTDVVLTRTSDVFVPLEERTAIANQIRADLFVSVHANSSRNRRISGVETFFLNFSSNADEREVASRENAGSQKNIRDLEDLLRQIALGDYNEESKDLAHVVQESLHRQMKGHRSVVRNRGVKKAPFIVLINLNMPGILAEVGFISNPADEKYFKDQDGQNKTAEALYEGIEKYLRSLGTISAYQGASVISTSSPD